MLKNKDNFFNVLNLGRFYLLFLVCICIFPTIRLLLIGGKEFQNIYEFIITAFPDILLLLFTLFSLVVTIKGNNFNFYFFDKLFIFFILFNTFYGFILSKNIFISLQGFRVTYLSMIFYFTGRIFSLKNFEFLCKKIFNWLFIFGIIGLIMHFSFRKFELYLISLSGNHESAYFIPRIGSFVLTPVLFSTLMTITLLYFYYRLLKENKKQLYIVILILWISILLSFSRGPIIAFLISFIFISIMSKDWKKSLIVLGIIIIVSSIGAYLLVGSFMPVEWLFSSTVDTLSFGEGITRVELWRHSIHDFIQKPFGYGLGHAGVTAIRFLKGTNITAAVYTSDGWFLKIACETGIPGLISYFAVFAIFFFKGLHSVKNKFSIFTFIFAVFLMINAQCIVANTLDFYPYMTLYWLLIGFFVNSFQKEFNFKYIQALNK